MYGISTTPTINNRPFSFLSQPPNSVNGLTHPPLPPPPPQSSTTSSQSISPISKNYNNTVNNPSISSNHQQKSQTQLQPQQQSASSSKGGFLSTLPCPPRSNNIPNDSSSTSINSNDSVFIRPPEMKRNGHNTDSSSVAHLSKHEVNYEIKLF